MERCDEERRGTCACGVPGSLDEWEEGFGVWRTQTSQSTPRRPERPLSHPLHFRNSTPRIVYVFFFCGSSRRAESCVCVEYSRTRTM